MKASFAADWRRHNCHSLNHSNSQWSIKGYWDLLGVELACGYIHTQKGFPCFWQVPSLRTQTSFLLQVIIWKVRPHWHRMNFLGRSRLSAQPMQCFIVRQIIARSSTCQKTFPVYLSVQSLQIELYLHMTCFFAGHSSAECQHSVRLVRSQLLWEIKNLLQLLASEMTYLKLKW